jgi:hypothetical protein
MLKSLYEHKKTNKNIYDGIRQYCIVERVNEEYLRSSISENGLGGKPIKRYIIIAVLILSSIGSGIGCSQNEGKHYSFL